jgi:dethiobiotin synthetase
MEGKVYFVSGIDTGVGKTVATGLMARSLRARGVDAITVKMVQTGNDGFSEDLDAHRAMCGLGRLPEDEQGLTAPQIFRFPSSPLLAARLEGRKVDLAKIASSVKACAAAHEVVLVESAGGLCVPLTDETLSVDFATAQGWPLILVTCGRLGSLNHTILSLEAAKARGMNVAGVVYNWFPDADPQIDEDSFAETRLALSRMGFPPAVVRVPQVPLGCPYPDIDFSELFGHDRA